MARIWDRWGIPCVYKGVTYRSRTEAKWAVWFDHLRIPYEPEPQGFDSRWGTSYLPDYLVHAACGPLWAEIKPTMQADPEGVRRWRNFAAERPQVSRAVLLIGAPRLHNDAIVIGGDESAADPGDGPWEDDAQIWRPCPSGQHFDLAFPGRFFAKFAPDGCEDKFGGLGEQAIEDAVEAASSYQFKRPATPAPVA